MSLKNNLQPALNVENADFFYPLYIGQGVNESVADFVAQGIKAKIYSGCVIVTDDHVSKHYAEILEEQLKGEGITLKAKCVLPAGEKAKSMETLSRTLEQILASGIDRKTLIIALGGGVVGDHAGFAASILLRGVPFIQVPTSLLAMVDSSVGGKTGVNAAAGKNLIGSFYQPDAVFIDTNVLKTLPERQLKAGYAEVVKYAFINDPEFFAWLNAYQDDIKSLQPAIMTQLIKTCCAHKATIVAADEKEHGARALLNLGHTFGHALEAHNHYGPELLHGEAVAIGMVLAFEFSSYLGLCPKENATAVKNHLKGFGLPVSIHEISTLHDLTPDMMIGLMHKDKKVSHGKLRLILAKGIGLSYIAEDITTDDLRVFLEKALSNKA